MNHATFHVPPESGIPDYMRQSIEDYITHGAPLGDFLTAVFANDFLGAYARADDDNVAAMRAYALLIYNDMPSQSHGSREIVGKWCERGGLAGTGVDA